MIQLKEGTNRTIFINSIILYTKLAVTLVCGLFTTKYALVALGVEDYGLYSVLGSMISFIAIINTIMVSSSQRFITVAIGEKNEEGVSKQFNVCLLIHVMIAILTLAFALPIGSWYVMNKLNYGGDIGLARVVFIICMSASAFSFISVPYNALLIAKENFWVSSIPDIISHILKLVGVIVLLFCFDNKLLVYVSMMAVLTIFPTIVYFFYTRRNHYSITKPRLVKDAQSYKEILGFSSLVAYGAFASVGKNQGSAIIVNTFFNTVMNAALGISNTIISIIQSFSNSIAQPIAPQITKSYVAGDSGRCEYLLILSTKLTFSVMLLISLPFVVETKWILSIWLGQVPEYAVGFTILLVVDCLIESLNSGIKNIIFASGKIKLFQILPSTIKLLSIVVGYFVLGRFLNPYVLFVVYILFTIINFFINQWVLHVTLNFHNSVLWRHSYLPSMVVVVFLLPLFAIRISNYSILNIIVSELYLLVLLFVVCLRKQERKAVYLFVKKVLPKK